MEEIRIKTGLPEKTKIKRIISDLFRDASFPGKEDPNTLLIRANSYTISILKNLSEIEIVEHKPMSPSFFAKKIKIPNLPPYFYLRV